MKNTEYILDYHNKFLKGDIGFSPHGSYKRYQEIANIISSHELDKIRPSYSTILEVGIGPYMGFWGWMGGTGNKEYDSNKHVESGHSIYYNGEGFYHRARHDRGPVGFRLAEFTGIDCNEAYISNSNDLYNSPDYTIVADVDEFDESEGKPTTASFEYYDVTYDDDGRISHEYKKFWAPQKIHFLKRSVSDLIDSHDITIASGIFCYDYPLAEKRNLELLQRMLEHTNDLMIVNFIPSDAPNPEEIVKNRILTYNLTMLQIVVDSLPDGWSYRVVRDRYENNMTLILRRKYTTR